MTRSTPLAIVAIGLGIFVTAAVTLSRGPLRELVTEFALPVSAFTSAVLSPQFPLALATIVALTLAKEFIIQSASIANTWNKVVVCLLVASLTAYMVGVFLSLRTLIGSLS